MKKLLIALLPIIMLLVFSACEMPQTHEHVIVEDRAVEPSCEKAGKTAGSHCLTCKKVIKAQRTIPASGHVEKLVEGYEASCTETGLTDGKICEVCDKVLAKQREISKLGHHIEIDSMVPATCTTPGLTMGSHCRVCLEIIAPQEELPVTAHLEKKVPGVEATCQSKGLTEGKICYYCGFVILAQMETDMTAHRPVTIPGVEASCQKTGLTEGSKCGDCDAILKAQESIAKTGHKAVVTPAVPGTCVSKGLTAGEHCQYCQKVIVAQKTTSYGDHVKTLTPAQLPTSTQTGKTERYFCSACGEVYIESYDPNRYNGSYGYSYIGSLKNGDKLQTAYERIDVMAQIFHMNAKDAGYVSDYKVYISEYLDIRDLKITPDELNRVLNIFFLQHQLYYWYNGSFYYSNASGEITKFALVILPEYADGNLRQQQNLRIYQTVQNMAVSSGSEYTLAKTYHDRILENMYYAYEADGKTPKEAEWAHSVIGYVEYGAGVCESYAEVFHMMLCFSGVESIRVHGFGNGDAHVWNLVKMDDGNWYWFDLTWDDYKQGYGYDYFCLNDTQKIGNSNKNFLTDHTYDTVNSPSRFQVPLPERSKKIFQK